MDTVMDERQESPLKEEAVVIATTTPTPAHEESPANDSEDLSSINNTNTSITQIIRKKLNFVDDRVWKRFSARRLELIDLYHLSDRKASEQYDRVVRVADQLRQEYGFPEGSLDDFDKLVRAAIQSVRRNRKRSRGRAGGAWDSAYSDAPPIIHKEAKGINLPPSPYSASSSLPLPHVSTNGFTGSSMNGQTNNSSGSSSSSTITTTLPPISNLAPPLTQPHTTLPPMNSLIGANMRGPNSSFLQALHRLKSVISGSKADTVRYISQDSYSANEDPLNNIEFLGSSILRASISLCIQRRIILDSLNETKARYMRKTLLTNTITAALASGCGLNSTQFIHVLGNCSQLLGFDSLINGISAVFMELIDLDPSLDYSNYLDASDRLAIFFPRYSDSYYPTAPATSITSITSLTNSTDGSSSTIGLSRIKPVILRFMNQKLDFTYQPGKSGPPTLSELLDNAHTAFNIAVQKVLLVRNVNRGGMVLKTDSDIADAFNDAKVDLEVTYPTQHL